MGDKPTTLHKQARKRDRSPVLSAESMAIYGPEHARLARDTRRPGSAPTFLSLFAGIGGIDLGLERAGFQCVGQVEIDPYCRRVLAKHWPDVPRFEDVRTFTKDNISEPIDLIAGGFPCQDISHAGAGAGLEGERSGLWFQYLRLIREIRPRFVVVENVAALLNRGMGAVLGGLAGCGFDAEWRLFQASEFGAPHRRERLFIIAYANEEHGQEGMGHLPHGATPVLRNRPRERDELWLQAAPGSDRVDDGVPSELYAARVGALGNAVVPQVAEWIGRRILAAMEGVIR